LNLFLYGSFKKKQTEKFTGPNKVLLVLCQRTTAHREDCQIIQCIYTMEMPEDHCAS